VLVMLGDQLPSTLTPEMIPIMRSVAVTPPLEELLAGHEVSHREVIDRRARRADRALDLRPDRSHRTDGHLPHPRGA